MRRRREWWRPYMPNTSDKLALISVHDDGRPDLRAVWRLRLTQIVGGKTWSLSLVRHMTPRPELTEAGMEWVRANLPDVAPRLDPTFHPDMAIGDPFAESPWKRAP